MAVLTRQHADLYHTLVVSAPPSTSSSFRASELVLLPPARAMPALPLPLRPQEIVRRLALRDAAPLAVIVRPGRIADWALLHLLSQALPPNRLAVLTTTSAARDALRAATKAPVHAIVPSPEPAAPASSAASTATAAGPSAAAGSSASKHTVDGGAGASKGPALLAVAKGGTAAELLRLSARWAVVNRVSDIAISDTRAATAFDAITRFDSTLPSHAAQPFGGTPCASLSAGVEMLPPDTLSIHRPFETIDESRVDATLPRHLLPSYLRDAPAEVARVAAMLGVDADKAPSRDAIVQHAERRGHATSFLAEESDIVVRAALLEASHWGYIVVRRSALLDAYSRGRGGRIVAIHAFVRMAMHVSGGGEPLSVDDENVSRMLDALLRTDGTGILRPLPKGRTVAGIVVRPATGRFAKRVLQGLRRRGGGRRRWAGQAASGGGWGMREREREREQPDDLMILTREPDNESGTLYSKRLKGNYACAPLTPDGRPVYWDNRFVIAAAPVSLLDAMDAPFRPHDIVRATVEGACESADDASGRGMTTRLRETELYVRQIRRADWEKITAITNRVREFQVPYECIRALPAVFQKESGSDSLGELVASPHLGISARPDLYFTAVRMPRFRVLPADMDPGFSEQHLRQPTPVRGRPQRERGREGGRGYKVNTNVR